MHIDWSAFEPWRAIAGGVLIGLSAVLFAHLAGRIAGISGIVGGLLRPRRADIAWRLAFIAGMLLASHIKSGRVEQVVPHSLRWTIGIQAVVLALIGFVPASVDHNVVTVPISFLAAVQIGLFRKIGDLAYLPVATTGNLMRFMESAYDSLVDKRAEARRPLIVYGTLIVAFASGAFGGAYATGAWGVHAIWLPSAFLAFTLCLFLVNQREWMR